MIEIIEADFSKVAHGTAIIQLMNEYAIDPMGGGKGLSDYVQQNLVSELAKRKTAHVILSFIDGKPAGLLIGLEGFSTFACKPLLNIHDVMVSLPYRGQGLSKLLFQKADEIAVELGCCKLTLEVLEGNYVAQSAYKSCGFSGYELNPLTGKALFWEKKLDKS